MSLAFLNPTRSSDEKRNAVSFLGHDGMVEIRFFVQAAALARSGEAQGTPEACLSAFDRMLAPIQEAARRAYAKHRDNAYTLTPADLR